MTEIKVSIATLPETLRAMRQEKGMTQAQAADMMGVCTESVCNWETGYRTPRWESFGLIADAYDCKIELCISEDTP